MGFYYDNQGRSTYLVYEMAENEQLDNVGVGMITNNIIPGLAKTIFTQQDNNKYFKYDVTAKVTARQFLCGTINKRMLCSVFRGIVNAIIASDEYMISPDSIVTDLDYVFVNVSTFEVSVISLPVISEERTEDIYQVLKEILISSRFDQNENGTYITVLFNYLNSNSEYSIIEFSDLLNSIAGQKPVVNNPQKNIIAKPATDSYTNDSVGSFVADKYSNDNKQMSLNDNVQQYVQNENSEHINDISMKGKAIIGKQTEQNNMPIPQSTGVDTANNSAIWNAGTNSAIPNSSEKIVFPVAEIKSNNADLEKKKHKFSIFGTKKENNKPKKEKAVKNEQVKGGFAIPGQATPVTQATVQVQQQQRQEVKQPDTPVQKPVTQIPAVPQHSVAPPVIQRPVQQVSGGNFGETTVLGGGVAGETTVLNAGASAVQQINPMLIRIKNNERIPINKPVFRIGKEKSYVDYFVADNTAISRSHANIIIREDKYFIVDTNSTNHTFIEGQMIPSSTEIEITHGTKIRLANEDFTFQLY